MRKGKDEKEHRWGKEMQIRKKHDKKRKKGSGKERIENIRVLKIKTKYKTEI